MSNLQEKTDFEQIVSHSNLLPIVKLLGEIVLSQTEFPQDILKFIPNYIGRLDEQLSTQLNQIIHHADFKALESSWRGLHLLVSNTHSGLHLKIKVISISKKELLKDFERSVSFDQSVTFKKIHDDEYGVFAGQPFAAIIGNYEFDLSPQDMVILENFAKVAEVSYAPFIANTVSEAIEKSSFSEQWQRFRAKPEAMFLSLCTPKILLRKRYGKSHVSDGNISSESFDFIETIKQKDDYLWGNAAFAFGLNLTEAFHKYKWCALIEGEENGRVATEIANIQVPDKEDYQLVIDNSLDTLWTKSEEEKLRDYGFNVISNDSDNVKFLKAISCAEPLRSDYELDNLELKQFVSLPQTFTVSRFANYLKMMIAHEIAWSKTLNPQGLAKLLNGWLAQYRQVEETNCTADFPLKTANAEISNDIWKPELGIVRISIISGYQIDPISYKRGIKIEGIPLQFNENYPISKNIRNEIPTDKLIEKNDDSQNLQSRNDRPQPSVEITYNCYFGGGSELRELPFILGVMGDFVGNPAEPQPNLLSRKFIEIDSDNFDQVLAAFKPRVNFKLKNILQNGASDLDIDLEFQCLEDFHPDNILQNIKPLKELVDIRHRLSDLLDQLDGNEKLENLLLKVFQNPLKMEQLIKELRAW